MGLINSPYVGGLGRGRNSAHVWCECIALASPRLAYLGSFFLDPEHINSLSLGKKCSFSKEQGSHDFTADYGAQNVLLIA